MSDLEKIRNTFFIRDGKLCVDKGKFNEYGCQHIQLLIERDPAILEIFKNHAGDIRITLDREILNRLLE